MKTTLEIVWKYEYETEFRVNVFHDVNANSIRLYNGFLWFASDENPDGWTWNLSMIYSMRQEGEA